MLKVFSILSEPNMIGHICDYTYIFNLGDFYVLKIRYSRPAVI